MPQPWLVRGRGVSPGRWPRAARTCTRRRSSCLRKAGSGMLTPQAPFLQCGLGNADWEEEQPVGHPFSLTPHWMVSSAARLPPQLAGRLNDAPDDARRVDVFSLGSKVEHQSVVECWHHHPVHIVVADVGTAIEERDHLSAKHEGLPAAGARPEAHIAVHVVVFG